VDGAKLTKKQREVIDAVAWWDTIGVHEPSYLQVGMVALIDTTGGYFSNVVGPLSAGGLIERGVGTLRLTDVGRAVASPTPGISSLTDYHDMLRQRVRQTRNANGKTVDILNALIRRNGEDMTNEEIGTEVGIDTTGGYYSNSIGPLGTLGLVERRAGVVRPTPLIFPANLV
jgi:hypothetical protein